MATGNYDSESGPWTALCRNVPFVADSICLCPDQTDLLLHMVSNRIISISDYNELLVESIPKAKQKVRLLDILRTKPPQMFPVFCDVLRSAGQDQLANRLEGKDKLSENLEVKIEGIQQLKQETELLEAQAVDLDRKDMADRQTEMTSLGDCQLFDAVNEGNIERTMMLLEKGVSVNARNFVVCVCE